MIQEVGNLKMNCFSGVEKQVTREMFAIRLERLMVRLRRGFFRLKLSHLVIWLLRLTGGYLKL